MLVNFFLTDSNDMESFFAQVSFIICQVHILVQERLYYTILKYFRIYVLHFRITNGGDTLM